MYESTKNPVCVWMAYSVARDLDVDPPAWIFEYLDEAATNLMWAVSQQPKKGEIWKRIVAAFGFLPGGLDVQYLRDHEPDSNAATREVGRFNPLARASFQPPAHYLSEAVRIYRQMGKTEAAAVRAAASLHNVSIRTVQRARKDFPAS
jgi:hypothetical protein